MGEKQVNTVKHIYLCKCKTVTVVCVWRGQGLGGGGGVNTVQHGLYPRKSKTKQRGQKFHS